MSLYTNEDGWLVVVWPFVCNQMGIELCSVCSILFLAAVRNYFSGCVLFDSERLYFYKSHVTNIRVQSFSHLSASSIYCDLFFEPAKKHFKSFCSYFYLLFLISCRSGEEVLLSCVFNFKVSY